VKSKLLHEQGGLRTYALVFDKGDLVMKELERFAREHELTTAHFTAIGALSDVVLGYFEWERKDYKEIPLDEQVEVLTLAGDVALADGEPGIHAHLVVGRSDGSAAGGHLIEATVRPTLELILTETPAHLRKRKDAETGLALIALES
jgi:predicted DNA-binding protein with PD1-like motif